jgi:ORF6N domain
MAVSFWLLAGVAWNLPWRASIPQRKHLMAHELIEKLSSRPIVYQGQRCITFALCDQMHERPKDTTNHAFHRTKARMTEGKHFFSMTVKELRELPSLRDEIPKGGNSRQKAYLLTEKGYAMIVKVFDDDLAWERQEQLVDGYFRQVQPASQEAIIATVLAKVTETMIAKMGEMMTATIAALMAHIESQRVAPLGPYFSPRERLNQLLGINAVYKIKEQWKANVIRHVLGEAARLGIALLRSGSGGSVVLMPIQFQAWAEQLMMMRISDWMTSQKTPLFDGQGTAH